MWSTGTLEPYFCTRSCKTGPECHRNAYTFVRESDASRDSDRLRKLCLKAHKRLRLLQSTPPDDDGATLSNY